MRQTISLIFFLFLGILHSLSAQTLERAIAIVDLKNDQSDIVDSQLFSAEHMVKVAGVPYVVTTDLESAVNNSIVLFSTNISNSTLSSAQNDLLTDYVENGGTLIIPRIEEEDLFPIFGVTSFESSTARYALTWDSEMESNISKWIDEPEERTLSLGRATNDAIYKTLGYTTTTASRLASFEDGSAAVTVNNYGEGQAITVGLLWKEIILRNQINRDYEAQRISSNGFEPTSDVFALMLRGLFLDNNQHAVWLHTSPSNSTTTLMVTHDVDSQTGMERLKDFVDVEKNRNIQATYNITVRYFSDALMGDFYLNNEAIMAYIKNNGQAFGSHSIGHFFDFADEDVFPIGEPGNTLQNYAPYNDGDVTTGGTIYGECELSKIVLEEDLELPINFFRAGHLAYPRKLIEVLEELGYEYNSSNSAADVLTHFPYQTVTNRSFSGKISSVYEIPVTISDVFHDDPFSEDNYSEKVAIWNEITRKNNNNGAPIVLLIHPNRDYKAVALEDYLGLIPETILPMEITQYGDFWKARENYKFSTTLDITESKLTINLLESLDENMSFVVHDGQSMDEVQVLDEAGNEIVFQSENWGDNDLLFFFEAVIISGIRNPINHSDINVNVFPNPTAQSITISIDALIKEDISVVLFDTNGKKVMNLFEWTENDFGQKLNKNIPTENLTSGTYMISFQSKGGVVAVRKIVIL